MNINVKERAKELQPYLVELRDMFHAYPETAGEEKETARRVVEELLKIGGYEIKENVGGYGVLADIKGAVDGPTMVLRADMDALNITEETGLSCCSKNEGKMHACGHDFHVTMLLGAARIIKEFQNELKGTIRLCFQPSEECTPRGGSRDMIEGGALENADGVFGLHVWPQYPAGVFGMYPGPMMAASDHFWAKFQGKASHAARPHEGVDALVAGAQFISAVQHIVSRNKNPLHDAVITMGKCTAGSAYNIVPEHCEVEGTCRTYEREDQDLIERRLKEVFDGVCLATGCTGEFIYHRGYISLINDPDMTEFMRDRAVDMFGEEGVYLPDEPSMAAEDFSFYLDKVPGSFGWLSCSKTESEAPLHNSKFDPDPEILWKGSALFANMALKSETMPKK